MKETFGNLVSYLARSIVEMLPIFQLVAYLAIFITLVFSIIAIIFYIFSLPIKIPEIFSRRRLNSVVGDTFQPSYRYIRGGKCVAIDSGNRKIFLADGRISGVYSIDDIIDVGVDEKTVGSYALPTIKISISTTDYNFPLFVFEGFTTKRRRKLAAALKLLKHQSAINAVKSDEVEGEQQVIMQSVSLDLVRCIKDVLSNFDSNFDMLVSRIEKCEKDIVDLSKNFPDSQQKSD